MGNHVSVAGAVGFFDDSPKIREVLTEMLERQGAAVTAIGAPCSHVRELVQRKARELDQRLAELTDVREGFRALLKSWRSARTGGAVVCPPIERVARNRNGG